jgi:hypothetical protein
MHSFILLLAFGVRIVSCYYHVQFCGLIARNAQRHSLFGQVDIVCIERSLLSLL